MTKTTATKGAHKQKDASKGQRREGFQIGIGISKQVLLQLSTSMGSAAVRSGQLALPHVRWMAVWRRSRAFSFFLSECESMKSKPRRRS